MPVSRRRTIALASAAIAAASLGRRRAHAAEPIRIGAINPYTGAMALYGGELTNGYELAADRANAAGGVLGRQIELLRGDAANPQQGISTVEQLAGKVDVFVGTYLSAVANSASDAALRYNRIYWDTNALAQNLTDRGLPNFIRSGPDAAAFARGSADTVTGLVGPSLHKEPANLTVWIEHEDSIYGTSIAATQKTLLESAGIKVLGIGAHSAASIDLTDSVLRAKRSNPDVWLNTGYVPDGNLLLRTAREQGFSPAATVFVGTGDTPETLNAVGAQSLEGMLVVSYPRPDVAAAFGPGAHEYLEAYRAKYHHEPVAPQGMAAYVGLQMLLEAITAAGGTDMQKVRDAAAKMDRPLHSYATGFGVKFDEHFQNTRAAPTTIQWQGGVPVTVFPKLAAQPDTTLKPLARG
ncbi:MAG: ABC transporter substrate-binding protein [Acidisphaera sp.]|nr:ABC transporter substrate-binding protein [Acidisphaera sp.]